MIEWTQAKHDAALQKFRAVDTELTQRVRSIEARIVGQAKDLGDRAPGYPSWAIPAAVLLCVACGVFGYVQRKLGEVGRKGL